MGVYNRNKINKQNFKDQPLILPTSYQQTVLILFIFPIIYQFLRPQFNFPLSFSLTYSPFITNSPPPMNLTQDLLPTKQTSHQTTAQGLSQQDQKQTLQKPSTPPLNINDALFCIRKYKYFNAIVLIISALCNSMIGVSFATINHEITQYYSVSTQLVSFCALQFLFINPLISLFANYILDNKGLKLGVSINCILNIIGVTLRLFINEWFGFVIIGNAFSAMGNIFIINCPARFSSVWFKPSERIVITSLIAFANAVSGQIGAIMSPYFVGNDLTPQEGRNSISQLIYFQAILVSSVMFINLMFFKGVPGKKTNPLQQRIQDIQVTPPNSNDFIFPTPSQISSQSSSQQSLPRPLFVPISSQSIESTHQQQKKQRHQRYLNQLKTLFTTKNYLFSLVSFSLIASVLNSFATNVELYILPFGFNSIDAGNLTFVSVGTGLAGAVLSSLIIKKLKKFKIVIQLEILLSVVFSVLLIVSLVTQQIWLLYLSVGLFTMLLYPLFPAIGEYCCQFMHPIRQSTVMGLLVGVAQLFSFAVGMIQTVLLQQKSQKNVVICLSINAGCYLVALITISFTKQNLKRLCQKQQN